MTIEIGKIIKAQGIKGEVKLYCFLDDSSMLKNVGKLYIGTKSYAVDRIRCDGAFCYILFEGVNDRNAAEALRNWTVYADKESVTVPQNRYFIDDLIDCVVCTDDGRVIGTVKNVLQYGAADVFVCKNNDVEVSFPFLNDLVIGVNIDNKTIVVNSRRFDEVAVYDD